ncbi:MAG: hypothetical protein AB7N76_29340 [Planctomycetota bacterium]
MPRHLPLSILLALALCAPAAAQDDPDQDSDVPSLATSKAFVWLKGKQEASGGWVAPEGREVRTTGLVVLAYLGQGHTHRFGTYKRTVSQGLRRLKQLQMADGSIGWEEKRPETILDHALATMALCEAYAVTRDFTLKRYAEKAVAFALGQGDPKAGWSRSAKGEADTLATAWMTLALKAAKTAGLEVPSAAWERIRAHFAAVTDKAQRVGGFPGGKQETADLPLGNAMAYLSRIFSGERRSELAPVLEPVLANLPAKGEAKLHQGYWFFATYSAFQAGGKAWKTWSEALEPVLIGLQQEDGAWAAAGPGKEDGDVYATAQAVMTLVIWARYIRMQQR